MLKIVRFGFMLDLMNLFTLLHQDNLIHEGKGLVSILYTYCSCVKALPQLLESMKDSQGDMYLEMYQVLDIEIGHL